MGLCLFPLVPLWSPSSAEGLNSGGVLSFESGDFVFQRLNLFALPMQLLLLVIEYPQQGQNQKSLLVLGDRW